MTQGAEQTNKNANLILSSFRKLFNSDIVTMDASQLFRELLNQVELLVEAEGSGVLEGAEIFCSWILLLQDMHIIRVTIIQKPYLH